MSYGVYGSARVRARVYIHIYIYVCVCVCVYTQARSLACVCITINEPQTRKLINKLCFYICTLSDSEWRTMACLGIMAVKPSTVVGRKAVYLVGRKAFYRSGCAETKVNSFRMDCSHVQRTSDYFPLGYYIS
jgi:hypothetical protein